MEHSLDGWDIAKLDDLEWMPWGSHGNAKAKLLATADGFNVALVVADPGYAGDPHVHGFPEFLYVVDGSVRTQGQTLEKGDGYAASTGSRHTDFVTESGATYLSIFKL